MFKGMSSLMGPDFKARVRELKNQVLDYTEAEMLVREITCNSPDPINPVLCRDMIKYIRTQDWDSVKAIMTKRLNSANVHHPLKVMQLIEVLLTETQGNDREKVWREVVIQHKGKIEELKFFELVEDKIEIGEKVRMQAAKLIQKINADQHKRDNAALGIATADPPSEQPGRSAAQGASMPAQQKAAPPPAPAPDLLDLLSMDDAVPQQQPPQQQQQMFGGGDPFGGMMGGAPMGGQQPSGQQMYGNQQAAADPFGGMMGGAPMPQQQMYGGQQPQQQWQQPQQQPQQQQMYGGMQGGMQGGGDPFGGMMGGQQMGGQQMYGGAQQQQQQWPQQQQQQQPQQWQQPQQQQQQQQLSDNVNPFL